MADDRSLTALARIERALARIDAAASNQPPPTDDSELIELREVHHALRSKVEGAITDLDRLLSAGGRS